MTLPLKAQKIISMKNMECLGYEVLLNFNPDFISSLGGHDKYILNGCALEHTLNYLHKTPKKDSYGKKIFINVDRSNLCNKIFLRKIVALSNTLYHKYDIELVIEITERNLCGFCSSISEGMLFLVQNKISLAADDFDIYNGDFRDSEVNIGMYRYIKIEAPTTATGIAVLNKYIKNNKHRNIILERVEHHHQLEYIYTDKIFAYQGYLFDKGASM
ncbi:hypothetical protein [Aeromonas enteropelogenes]|uniref:hypothetical protein n=1 Tax=Aeromonas enteropelogenes TaxID=29489 RepID=UPI003BA08853